MHPLVVIVAGAEFVKDVYEQAADRLVGPKFLLLLLRSRRACAFVWLPPWELEE